MGGECDRLSDGTAALNATPRISVVMPVYNGANYLRRSLVPLSRMLKANEIEEILVADDASTDDSVSIIRSFGIEPIQHPSNLGPSAARNVAANAAVGNIVWFVDADVVVHDDAADIIRAAFSGTCARPVAVFGSYDDQPAAPNFLSQYKNLIHHYVHQNGCTEATTFWSGCGAVDKAAFLNVGGFDPHVYNLEDVDLGYRLRGQGNPIRLLKTLQGTHLKEWRLKNLLHTEIFSRAIPWSRLMLSNGSLEKGLNASILERYRAIVGIAAVLLLIGLVSGVVSTTLFLFSAIVALLINLPLFWFFVRKRGVVFAIGALSFHQIYYVYSVASFLFVSIEFGLQRLYTKTNRT